MVDEYAIPINGTSMRLAICLALMLCFSARSAKCSADQKTLVVTAQAGASSAVANGAGSNAEEPFNRLPYLPAVVVGERPASVTFAGIAPGFAGVYRMIS